MQLHQAFKALRVKQGVPQKRLAQKARCGQTVVSRLETGRMHHELEDIWIKKFLFVMGLSVEELMKEWNIWAEANNLPGHRVKRQ